MVSHSTPCQEVYEVKKSIGHKKRGSEKAAFQVLINLQYSQEGFLGYLYGTDLAHPLFTFFLLFK